jgi:hypothetical protein
VGNISDISKVHDSSIFRVKMRKVCQCLSIIQILDGIRSRGLVVGTKGDNTHRYVIKMALSGQPSTYIYCSAIFTSNAVDISEMSTAQLHTVQRHELKSTTINGIEVLK